MPDGANTTPTETTRFETHVKTRIIACDGGDGPYGHPKVYLRITASQITCPYCSRLFILEPGTGDSAH